MIYLIEWIHALSSHPVLCNCDYSNNTWFLSIPSYLLIMFHAVSSWTITEKLKIDCQKDTIWEILTDIPGWNQWYPDIFSSSITERPSQISLNGASGIVSMKPEIFLKLFTQLDIKALRTFSFTLHSLEKTGYFAYRTRFVGVSLHWFWKFENVNGEMILTEGVHGKGSFKLVYKYFVVEKYRSAFRKALANFKNICEAMDMQI